MRKLFGALLFRVTADAKAIARVALRDGKPRAILLLLGDLPRFHNPPRLGLGAGQQRADHLAAEQNRAFFHAHSQ
ncbi:hypothetical protein [Chromobacterium phragmitis]|uniref:hypothetical protein n=1 Tax=Chromobacterium phragmitis TaxID=2202141 RepID=UPI003877D39E